MTSEETYLHRIFFRTFFRRRSDVSDSSSNEESPVYGNDLNEAGNMLLLQFYEVASLQGRISYFFMSIYIVNPELLTK